jgi:hypothetical protein
VRLRYNNSSKIPSKMSCVPNLTKEAILHNELVDKVLSTPAPLKSISLKDMTKMTTEDWIAFFKVTGLKYPDETNRFNQRALPIISTDDLFQDASINRTRPISLEDGVYYNSPYAPNVTIKDNRITRAEIYMPLDTVRPSVIWHFEYTGLDVKSYREFLTDAKFAWDGPGDEVKKLWDEYKA